MEWNDRKKTGKMMMLIEKWKQRGAGSRKKAVLILAGCLILAGASFTVYSKYYKTRYEKGMAIASGFYFSSNYMYEEEGLNDIEDIEELTRRSGGKLVHEDLVNRLMVAVSNKPWAAGNSYTFDVEVRNHINQLLYNDQELNVAYMVEFVLLDEPDGADYSVGKTVNGADVGNDIPLNDGNTIKKAGFQGTLEGGRLTWENYVLRVRLGSGQTADSYKPARVLMMAYPVEPAFLEDTKKIAGIIKAEYNITEMEITDQKFTIEDELKEDSWQEQVKKESALVYQLKTTGNYFVQETDNMMQKIRIKWNPNIFSLNKNDRYLNHAEGTRLVEYDGDAGVMVIETAPYSSIKFVFFKKEDFDAEIQSMMLDEFKNTIQAEKVE